MSKNLEEYINYAGIWKCSKKRMNIKIAIKGSSGLEVINKILSNNSTEGIIKLYKLNEQKLEAIPYKKILVINEITPV
jgi:hypothetical protein